MARRPQERSRFLAVRIAGPHGSRTIPLQDFFVGPGRVDLLSGEFLVEIILPKAQNQTRMAFYKLGPRRAMDCSVVSVAVAIRLDRSTGRCELARIALGAVSQTPVRAKEAEKVLEDNVVVETTWPRIAEAVRREIRPIADVRASAEYRHETAVNLTLRAIQSLMNGSEA